MPGSWNEKEKEGKTNKQTDRQLTEDLKLNLWTQHVYNVYIFDGKLKWMVIYGNDFLEPIKNNLKFRVSNKLIFAMDNSNKKTRSNQNDVAFGWKSIGKLYF